MILLAQSGFQLPPAHVMAAIAIVIFLGIGIHEFAHAKVADLAGDPTPGSYGRVTLDLTKHFELMGTIFIVLSSLSGFGIGWGKPVPMDPRKMRNPRWDHFAAVAAGPLSNLIQAVIYAIFFRIAMAVQPAVLVGGEGGSFLGALLLLGTLINISLFLFNLLPMGPLDGMWIVGTFLPDRARYQWTKFNLEIGTFLFIALILIGQVGGTSVFRFILGPPADALQRILLGV